eukprot:scaffold150935_cov32-Tisochrysis_lutea.AAC.4
MRSTRRHASKFSLSPDLRPTSVTSEPGRSGRGESAADRTITSSGTDAGSYLTIAKLCIGWTYSTEPETVTRPPNVIETSPNVDVTVLRSTAMRPRSASTTSPKGREKSTLTRALRMARIAASAVASRDGEAVASPPLASPPLLEV